MKLLGPILALLLLAAVATIQPALAAAPTSSPPTPIAEQSDGAEAEEVGEAEEECEGAEAGEEEAECEGAEEEFEVAGGTSYLPAGCLLRSAEPIVSTQGHGISLTLRYTADAPTRLGVEYWLKGSRGTLRLGSQTKRIGTHGTLRLRHRLSDGETARVRAARVFVVAVDVHRAPAGCASSLTLRLASKHLRGAQETWSE